MEWLEALATTPYSGILVHQIAANQAFNTPSLE